MGFQVDPNNVSCSLRNLAKNHFGEKTELETEINVNKNVIFVSLSKRIIWTSSICFYSRFLL